MFKLRGAMIGLAGLLLAGCGVGEGTGSTPPWADTQTPVAPPASTPDQDEEVPEMVEPFRVRMETTKGDVIIDVHPEWAPRGAARFKELVESGYYSDNRVFRVVPGFVVQFGMHGDPEMNRTWSENRITDDRVAQSNRRGTVTFATSGADARTTQIFINLGDNQNLDTSPGNFAPFGEVVEGMDVVDSFNAEYAEAPSREQPRIMAGGNKYLDAQFPGLDSIVKATIVESDAQPPADGEAGHAEATGEQQTPAEKTDAATEGPDEAP